MLLILCAICMLEELAIPPDKPERGDSQHACSGHYRPTSEMPFKWRFAGEPLVAASMSAC